MTTTLLEQALAAIPDWPRASTRVLQDLGGSTTNQSWLVEHAGRRYVLRVDLPRAARLGLDRRREIGVREQAVQAGIAPRIVYASPDARTVLSEYKPGRTWSTEDLHDAENLRLLAQQLQTLHTLPVVGKPLDLARSLLSYAAELGDSESQALASDAVKQLGQIDGVRVALCHNDLVAANMVAGEVLWLIDWEYAGVGDPLFDLAVVIEHHGLPPELWRQFVELCTGHTGAASEQNLTRYRVVYQALVNLWSRVV